MVATSGLVIIGFFVWWAIRDVKISKTAFKALLQQAGLSFKCDQEDTALRRTSFLKAVRETKVHNQKKFLIRKIVKEPAKYVFGLVDESIDKAGHNLEYNHSATCTFNPETGELTCDFSHRAFDDIKSLYNEYQEMMNSDDVRDAVIKIISEFKKVNVRQRGGIYFLPNQHEADVEKMEVLVESLPGDCSFSIAPQIDTEKSKKAIYKAFVEGLKYKMATFREELENPAGKTRKATWETRLQQFKGLKQEIEFYRDAMSFQVEDLSTELESLRGDVQKQLLG